MFLFAVAGLRRADGAGEAVGETTGDGDGSAVGLALGLGTAAASGTELRDLTAINAMASTSTTATAPKIINNCFVERLLKGTERRENE